MVLFLDMNNIHKDIVIIGAGVSGIGAACHLSRKHPNKSYIILESRKEIGGTWSLFKYPGIRSDSDMYTFGYSFKIWDNPKSFADAPSILKYLNEASNQFKIKDHIKFQKRAISYNGQTLVRCYDALKTEIDQYQIDGEIHVIEPKEIPCRFQTNLIAFIDENISWGAHRIYTLVTRDFWGLESADSISGAAITQVLFFGDRYGLSDQLDIFSLDLTFNEETYYQRESTGSILRLMMEESAFYLMDNPIRGQRTVDTGIIDPAVMWIESLAENPFDSTNSLKFDMAKKYHDVLNKTDGTPSSRLGYPMHFSPNGKTLFFTDNDLGDPNLVMMDMDSGDVTILSEIFTDLWFDMNPAGDTLVFVKNIGHSTAVYSFPLDSNAVAIRLSYEVDPRSPLFSVDGSLVVYTARDRFGGKNLYTIRPDGSGFKKVTTFNDPADAVVPVGITLPEYNILYVMPSQITKNQFRHLV